MRVKDHDREPASPQHALTADIMRYFLRNNPLVARLRIVLVCAVPALFAAPAVAQDWVMDRLNNSPRHHEWVSVEHGDRTVEAFVAYPESDESVLALVVIHENRGLNDWVRGVADQIAEAGYIAIAPDLLSGIGPDGGKTSDFVDPDAARAALYELDPDQVTADLRAIADHVANLPAANGKVAVMGFCWGGSQTFRFATNFEGLSAAFPFYGTAPDDGAALAQINVPVYGFYGGNDERVNATIPETSKLMQSAGETYEPVIYEGAGHGFMRSGEDPNGEAANRKAREEAWVRLKELLSEL
jgi:carboxymethylenebutenolidase